MLFLIISLLVAAGIIYLSCEYFVNGIEWVGRKFSIAASAVGTVLAAFGTALPESVVTLIAVVYGATPDQKDIGVGAALGGPLILGTVAYAVAGAAILGLHPDRQQLAIDQKKIARDQLWFLAIFICKIMLGFVVFPGKPWTSLLFVLAYAWYCYRELHQNTGDEHEELEALKFQPGAKNPSLVWVLVQTVFSLLVIFAASHVFVTRLGLLSVRLGIQPHLIALLLSPIATELPETLNAIIWIKQKKIMLALGNISGAMMIQATIPSALGIAFTPWRFDAPLALAGALTMVSIGYLWLCMRLGRITPYKLMFALVFYCFFTIGIIILR